MLGFIRSIFDGATTHRLRRHALRDSTPEGAVRLCKHLQKKGRVAAAEQAAKDALTRFPSSGELQQILRATWRLGSGRRIQELERRLVSDPSRPNHQELAEAFLSGNDPDGAARVAAEVVRRWPEDASAHLLHGRVSLSRFHRDHVAKDGAAALKSFTCAVELDPRCLDAHIAIARSYYYIGAVSKALAHIYKAQDLAPDDPEVKKLHAILLRLPLEKLDEHELLREVEEADEAHFRYEPEVRERPAAIPMDVARRVEQLSLMAGVRRAAYCRRNQELEARGGHRITHPEGESAPFIELAAGFRRTASLSAKRMGIGAFEEAELSWPEGRMVASSAGPSILLVEVEPSARLSTIASEARHFIAATASGTRGRRHA